jgi:hypothetical protein
MDIFTILASSATMLSGSGNPVPLIDSVCLPTLPSFVPNAGEKLVLLLGLTDGVSFGYPPGLLFAVIILPSILEIHIPTTPSHRVEPFTSAAWVCQYFTIMPAERTGIRKIVMT